MKPIELIKPELLSPAGTMEALKGAVNAGADAVYLGAYRYGARAYAGNFGSAELIRALDFSHIRGVKVYLAVNTLMFDSEIDELIPFLLPYYRRGLDGVIVQDYGALSLIVRELPELPVHASTQMSVSTPVGAGFLRSKGAVRVVPSRELSLPQLERICDTGIEVEAFIHGAMCYSYSGRCLMSSLIGGRSGNRGRCAQPCRLAYSSCNPLSLRDMCTVDMIPQLIEAGISSFKIEGRMKKPEYSAGVTAVYRRAIDEYLSTGRLDGIGEYLNELSQLYIRTDTGRGYYAGGIGADMLTGEGPGYDGASKELLEDIRKSYLESDRKLPVSIRVECRVGKPLCIHIKDEDQGFHITYSGATFQAAQKRPLTADDIRAAVGALGDTDYVLTEIVIDMDDNSFLPVKALKDARRQAVDILTEKLLARYLRAFDDSESTFDCSYGNKKNDAHPGRESGYADTTGEDLRKKVRPADAVHSSDNETVSEIDSRFFSVHIDSAEQLRAFVSHPIADRTLRLYLHHSLMAENGELCGEIDILRDRGIKVLTSLPMVLKDYSEDEIAGIVKLSRDGVFCHDTDSLAVAVKYLGADTKKKWLIAADSSVYVWNRHSRAFLEGMGVSPSVPLEPGKDQLRGLHTEGMEMSVYGRLPLMVSANCTALSMGECRRMGSSSPGYTSIIDRKGERLPVKRECSRCHNVIYSAKPLSLHEYSRSVCAHDPGSLRLTFTDEGCEDTRRVLDLYEGLFMCRDGRIIPTDKRAGEAAFDFTTGAYKKSVE